MVAHGKPAGQEQHKNIAPGKRPLDTRPKAKGQRHEHGVESEHLRARRIRPDDWARAKERRCHEPGGRVARPRPNHGAHQASRHCHRHGREQIHSPNRRVPQRKRGEKPCQQCKERIARRMGNAAGERCRREFAAVAARHRGIQSRDVESQQKQNRQIGSEPRPPSQLVRGGRRRRVATRAFPAGALALPRCSPAFSHGLVCGEYLAVSEKPSGKLSHEFTEISSLR